MQLSHFIHTNKVYKYTYKTLYVTKRKIICYLHYDSLMSLNFLLLVVQIGIEPTLTFHSTLIIFKCESIVL